MSTAFRLIVFVCVTALFLSLTSEARAQQEAPVIDVFSYEKVRKDGRDWIYLSWRVQNTDRVYLFSNGQPVDSRSQLPDGTFGWPPVLNGSFGSGASTGDFTLVAQNPFGRVEARGKIGADGCLAWLTPPDKNWTRCRAGGIIAANLGTGGQASGTGKVVVTNGRCEAVGVVHAARGFAAKVPRNPLNPKGSIDTFVLDHVVLRNESRNEIRQFALRSKGTGKTRSYHATGLRPGNSYVLGLPGGWRADPQFIRFNCPRREGTVRRHLTEMTALGFSSD
ncbi:hypothetical protein R3X27_08515 [Tropicimonas sp. TH_r6]|uniref:hypothetical protein n=1 Tax=Tropicimonas sp. TH_r6 TaxID=3082085 RepID=UPI002954B023|nr:hypothetical protein [Tropicimonas sp. TH_r6]MDV7142724.1 hypothetical protein [Tropicimonas sp. TH_r6]